MPTIQVRTDDQTKTASMALFEQLGLTMSDAINLFLRQTILRGEIPFTLSVSGRQFDDDELIENEALIDALRRYKSVNGKIDFDIAKAEPFIQAIDTLDTYKNMRITLQKKAVKIKLQYKNKDYVLDYNYEESDNVFILHRKSGKLIIKDCNLSSIKKTMEKF